MKRIKYSLFCKGDLIRTNPQKGFYGIAVVLDDGEKMELSRGRWSYPMCHIAITPQEKKIPWRDKLCIDIYTARNKSNLPVIGNIGTTSICDNPLPFIISENGFHLRGDVDDSLGREAYISWCREKEME